MSNAAVDVMSQANELSCVVIPTDQHGLLLPNVCVAEIVPWRRIAPVPGSPGWCLGKTSWRGLTIAVLNYAAFATGNDATPAARCLVVMNRARNAAGPAFYAFAASSLPYMVQLSEEDLQSDKAPLGTADVMNVKLGTEQVSIPDLEFIETEVGKLMRGNA